MINLIFTKRTTNYNQLNKSGNTVNRETL